MSLSDSLLLELIGFTVFYTFSFYATNMFNQGLFSAEPTEVPAQYRPDNVRPRGYR